MEKTIAMVFAVILAIVLMVIALRNRRSICRLLDEREHLKANLTEAENEKKLLVEMITEANNKVGIGESTVLAIAGEITRMENNLYRMEDVPGRKQVLKAVERMKASLQAEGYMVVPLLGMPYREGMQMNAVFVVDESLPQGDSVIISVQKPQVNHNGKMIQAASVTVGQNI